jgi:periplasmic divalent cation tolerance protein
MTIVSIYATFANAEEAARIARILVEERLVACANILGPCRSIYRWEGEVQEGEEIAAIFKTSGSAMTEAAKRIAELHSYDVPAITATTAGWAPGSFADWVYAETRKQ